MKAERLAARLAAISVMHLVDGRTDARTHAKAAISASGSRLRPASRYKQRVFVISRARLHGGRSHLGGLFLLLLLLLFVLYAGWVGNVWREMKGEGEINTESKHARQGKAGRNLRIMTKSSCE